MLLQRIQAKKRAKHNGILAAHLSKGWLKINNNSPERLANRLSLAGKACSHTTLERYTRLDTFARTLTMLTPRVLIPKYQFLPNALLLLRCCQ